VIPLDARRLGALPQTPVPDWESEKVATLLMLAAPATWRLMLHHDAVQVLAAHACNAVTCHYSDVVTFISQKIKLILLPSSVFQLLLIYFCRPCLNTVGWAPGSASGL